MELETLIDKFKEQQENDNTSSVADFLFGSLEEYEKNVNRITSTQYLLWVWFPDTPQKYTDYELIETTLNVWYRICVVRDESQRIEKQWHNCQQIGELYIKEFFRRNSIDTTTGIDIINLASDISCNFRLRFGICPTVRLQILHINGRTNTIKKGVE